MVIILVLDHLHRRHLLIHRLLLIHRHRLPPPLFLPAVTN